MGKTRVVFIRGGDTAQKLRRHMEDEAL